MANKRQDASRHNELTRSLRDYIRAAGGGLIVGLPLLFTMEVWWQGFQLPWWKILLLLAIGFGIVLGYNAIAGFRSERTLLQLFLDSVLALGLAIVIATIALILLGRIDSSTSLRDAAGKIALEAIPVAFGASLAATQFGGRAGNEREETGPFERLLVGAGGALIFALNVAPTEEPVMLGIEAPFWLLVLVIAATLVLTYALVFFADFGGRRRSGEGILGNPLSETVAAYVASLLVALLLLWSFGRFEGVGVAPMLAMTVMLAVVGSVGAAVGRLLVGGHREAGAE
jgi:putative integral membrane protein (TIGR02587 family)